MHGQKCFFVVVFLFFFLSFGLFLTVVMTATDSMMVDGGCRGRVLCGHVPLVLTLTTTSSQPSCSGEALFALGTKGLAQAGTAGTSGAQLARAGHSWHGAFSMAQQR